MTAQQDLGVTFRLIKSGEKVSQTLYELSEDSFEFGSPWTVDQFKETIALPHLFYLAAEYQGEIIGFLSGSMTRPEAEVYNIVVKQEYKRKGIAYNLIRETKKIMQENKVLDLFLEVRVSNFPAIKLYKKAGFLPVGVRTDYYSNPKEDAAVLKCAI